MRRDGKERRPKFEYTGQPSEEILAHLDSHATYSVLYALEWGLLAKARARGGEDKLSEEERLFLAVLALEREVNNGGYKQFFWNTSRRFTPTIVQQLRRIGCFRTAALTDRAVEALALNDVTMEAVTEEIQKQNLDRDAKLEACSKEFYTFNETTQKLAAFVVAEHVNIQSPRTDDYPRRPARPNQSPSSSLYQSLLIRLATSAGKWNPGLEEARTAALEIMKRQSLPATHQDIEGAAALLAFEVALHKGDLDSASVLAPQALNLMGENRLHMVQHLSWVKALLAAGQAQEADNALLAYLQYILDLPADKGDEKIAWSARLLSDHGRDLPQSSQFFAQHFPGVDLDKLPTRTIAPARELYAKSKPPSAN